MLTDIGNPSRTSDEIEFNFPPENYRSIKLECYFNIDTI